MLTVAVNSDGLALQRLNNEIRDDAAITWVHARPIGVENTRNFNVEIMLAVIVEKERFGAAFAFIVASARADRVNIAPIAFRLWMHRGVAVNL